jgi:hypothetical protein
MSERGVVSGLGVFLEIEGKRMPCLARGLDHTRIVVIAEAPLPAGATVQLELLFRGERTRCKAKVESVSDKDAELAFTDVDEWLQGDLDRLVSTIQGQSAGPAPAGAIEARVVWTHLPDGRSWNWWRKLRHAGHVVGLAAETATIVTKARPDVGETVLIFLGPASAKDDALATCRAECTAHAEAGFAVKFLSPRTEFKRVLGGLLHDPTLAP